MKCAECRVDIPKGSEVVLNGSPLHVGCFRIALRKFAAPFKEARRALEDLTVDVRNVDAPIAYELGKDTINVLVKSARRGTK